MAWKARAHYLSRNPAWVLSIVITLLGVGLLLALLVVQLQPRQSTSAQQRVQDLIDSASQQLRDGRQKLMQATEPDPWALARWLRRIAYQWEEPRQNADKANGADAQWTPEKWMPLLEKHARNPVERDLFVDYLAAARQHLESPGAEALARLEVAAAADPPVPLANQLRGQLLVQWNESRLGMECFIREGTLSDDAAAARAEALHWAVDLRDAAQTRALLDTPGWAQGSDPAVLYHAALLTGDLLLQWESLFHLRLQQLPLLTLGLALAAIGLWYVILVQHRPGSPAWRWASPLLPLIAGVLSIWPTLSLVAWQEQTLGLSPDAPFPHNLWYYFGGIALREELCKLALFAPFLPWLLKRREPGMALMTAAFVGLGFALEENIGYYDASGGGVVWGRFVTANFFHAALTGLAGLALYQVIQRRFHDVGEFVAKLIMVIAAHGFYDLVIELDNPETLGIGFLSIVLLVVMANQFFAALSETGMTPRHVISPGAVFAIGSALLVATLFVAAAWVEGTTSAVADVGLGCLSVVPVGVVYWRRLA